MASSRLTTQPQTDNVETPVRSLTRALQRDDRVLRTFVTTEFLDPDGVEQWYDLSGIASDFAPPGYAFHLNRGDDLYARIAVGVSGDARLMEFRWGDPERIDTTQTFFRSVKRETEHAFESALRLNPFVDKYNQDKIFRPDTLVLRIYFSLPPTRGIPSHAL